jgi:hypothetical protein
MSFTHRKEVTVHTPSIDIRHQRSGQDENALERHAGPDADRGMREDVSRVQ